MDGSIGARQPSTDSTGGTASNLTNVGSNEAPLSPVSLGFVPSSPRHQLSNGTSVSPMRGPSSVGHAASPGMNSMAPVSPVDLTPFNLPTLDYSNSNINNSNQFQLQQPQEPLVNFLREDLARADDPRYEHNFDTEDDEDDDERTEPSSTVTGNTGDTGDQSNLRTQTSDQEQISTFGRILHSTRKRLSSGNEVGYQRNPAYSVDDDDLGDGALIYGYLRKLGRNGKWQMRWFETDGVRLAYYKSDKRIKRLASLDLAKVGSIVVNHEDPKGTSFTISISERPYELRADSKSACNDWVIMLNRIKEARLQEGNVKLSNGARQKQVSVAPRVVVVANRQRTHKMLDEESWDQSMGWEEESDLARWRKSQNSVSKIGDKVLRWARSMQKYGCSDSGGDVVLGYQQNYQTGQNESTVSNGGTGGPGLPGRVVPDSIHELS